jgi:hypothetical protein
MEGCTFRKVDDDNTNKFKEDNISYVGSYTCKSCHANENAEWQKSDHA